MKNVFSREILQRLQQKWQQYEHDSSLWDQKGLEWFNAGTTVLLSIYQCRQKRTWAASTVLAWSSGIQVHVILLSWGGLAENHCISCEINERCKWENVQVVCSAVSVIQVLAAFTKPVMIEFVELVQYPSKPQRCYHSIAHVVDVLLQRW